MDEIICMYCSVHIGSKPSADGTNGQSHGVCDKCEEEYGQDGD